MFHNTYPEFSSFLARSKQVNIIRGDVRGFDNALVDVNDDGEVRFGSIVPNALLDCDRDILYRQFDDLFDTYMDISSIREKIARYLPKDRHYAWSELQTFINRGGKTREEREEEEDGHVEKWVKFEQEEDYGEDADHFFFDDDY